MGGVTFVVYGVNDLVHRGLRRVEGDRGLPDRDLFHIHTGALLQGAGYCVDAVASAHAIDSESEALHRHLLESCKDNVIYRSIWQYFLCEELATEPSASRRALPRDPR